MEDVTTTATSEEVTTTETSSTSTENVSTSTETVETSETTADENTSDVTPDSTATEEQAPTTTNFDYEKSYKELQGTYTKTSQELAQLKRDMEALRAKPAVVQTNGEFDPQVVNNYALQIANEELGYYRQGSYSLDVEEQKEVNQLLNNYQATGDQRYLQQAKSYFNGDFVSQVTQAKTERAYQIKEQLEKQKADYLANFKTNYHSQINEIAPTAKAYSDKESPYYNEDLANAVDGAMNGNVSVEQLENIFKGIEEAIIKKYQADLKTRAQVQAQTKTLTAPATAVTPKSTIPTTNDLAKMSQEDYNKAVETYGLEKILAAR